jgi:hypothetical protein
MPQSLKLKRLLTVLAFAALATVTFAALEIAQSDSFRLPDAVVEALAAVVRTFV